VHGFSGQAMTVVPGTSACLRCVVQRAPPVVETPVIGAACGVIGSIQALEAVKWITGRGDLLADRLLLWDGLAGRLEELAVERNPHCPACSGDREGR
jgi:adenylyltransferase/sulfurtransferase